MSFLSGTNCRKGCYGDTHKDCLLSRNNVSKKNITNMKVSMVELLNIFKYEIGLTSTTNPTWPRDKRIVRIVHYHIYQHGFEKGKREKKYI